MPGNISIDLPKDIEFIGKIKNVDWSMIVSRILKSKLKEISKMQKNLSKSKLTEEDVEEFTDKINTSLSKRYI